MPTADIRLPAPHPGQVMFEQSPARFRVMCNGRRWGKDIELQRTIIRKALKTKQPVAWFAPTYRMLLENWRQVRHLLAPVTARASDSEHRIDLVTGNALEMWSLDNHDAARGRKYGYIAINEAAMVAGLLDAWNMVIRPTLTDYKGHADFASTPRGLNGFYDLWQQAESAADWARFHFTTYDNPHIDKAEVDALKEALPERVFKQEILAEFVEDGAFFQNVDKCAVITEKDAPEKHAGHVLFMATDWAKSNDYHVSAVGCRNCRRVVDWERFNKLDYIYQLERMKSLYKRWHPQGLIPERNSMGEPNVERLMVEGLPVLLGPDDKPGFYTTALSKVPIIESLAQSFILHGFLVPEEAKHELTVFEVNIMPSGYQKFGAPDNQHDDWVMVLAMLWWAMSNFTTLPNTQPTQQSRWNAGVQPDIELASSDGSRWRKY